MHEVDVAGTATKQETGFDGRRVAGGWFEGTGALPTTNDREDADAHVE